MFLYTASKPDDQASISGVEREGVDLELPLFDMATIEAATNNFSAANKIGAGGFGPVYKVKYYFAGYHFK